jgi:hypothetical protein
MANTSSKDESSADNKSIIETLTEDFDQLELLQKLQIVVDTIPQSIFWKNLNSEWVWGNARFVSDAGADTLEDILGKNDLSFADRPWTRDQGESFIRDDRDVFERENRNLTSSNHNAAQMAGMPGYIPIKFLYLMSTAK